MATQTNYISGADPRFPGVNQSELQEAPILLDVYDAMADDDDTKVTLPATGNPGLMPRLVQVARHTGGDITSAAAATRAMSNGDTAEFIIDPAGKGDSRALLRFTHVFVGLTGGAATPTEIAASINGDANLTPYVRAVAGLTANAVTLFPKTARGRVTVGAQPGVLGFSGTADYAKRIYVSQTCPILTAGTGWSWSYDANTRILTIKNETGGAVNRVHCMVHV